MPLQHYHPLGFLTLQCFGRSTKLKSFAPSIILETYHYADYSIYHASGDRTTMQSLASSMSQDFALAMFMETYHYAEFMLMEISQPTMSSSKALPGYPAYYGVRLYPSS